MRAFLSHSSADKGFVEAVADNLKPGTYELDATTFDLGAINSHAIITALARSDLFCLFLSKNSIKSSYVAFETLLGVEYLAKASISQFLVICLDEEAFYQANYDAKFFNIVRKPINPESAARLIQGHLISSGKGWGDYYHPFVGREGEIDELEKQISDPERPPARALYISGNPGSGRKTLARKFYEQQFPHVGKIFARIDIGPFDGLEELFRSVLMSLRPSISVSELRSRIDAFTISNLNERSRQIADLLNSLIVAREAAFLIDHGGVINNDGAFTKDILEVLPQLDVRPHPSAIFITTRVMPKRFRRKENDIAYADTPSLKWDSANRLISRLLKDRGITASIEQLAQLTDLSERHPYNIYSIIDHCDELGVAAFLSNIREFNDWKHRQSSSYVEKIKFDEVDCVILGVLKIVSALDFESIVLASQLPADQVQLSLQKLAENHVVEAGDNNFLIAPAVRIAVEKDGRIRLDKSAILAASRAIAASLSLRIEEGGAPFSLLDAAILASIQSGDVLSEFVAAFMLPSHQVWLCRHHYDLKHWSDCIRLGLEALKGASRLSTGAFVAACRYVCLAAARIGRDDIFDEVINKLEKSANDDWGRSNVAYLKGFRARNKGHLLEAESWFYDSYKLSAGNHSALRELAAISLVRGNMEIAETYAREALKNAPTNPYLIDILLSILIRKRGKAANGDREVRDLFDILERVGEEDGRSFYTTRKAEFEYVSGNYSGAASFIRKAIEKTPTLFEPRRIYAEILLKQGNKSKALEVIDVMKNMVAERENSDRRTNYRLYLEVLSKYHLETGNFSEARAVFQDSTVFTQIEAAGFIKKIDIAESFFRHKK